MYLKNVTYENQIKNKNELTLEAMKKFRNKSGKFG